jgi:hypothetical protein
VHDALLFLHLLTAFAIVATVVLAAIVLWAIATELGRRAQVGYAAAIASGAEAVAGARPAALMHWLRSLVVLALLVVMVYKPGA